MFNFSKVEKRKHLVNVFVMHIDEASTKTAPTRGSQNHDCETVMQLNSTVLVQCTRSLQSSVVCALCTSNKFQSLYTCQ